MKTKRDGIIAMDRRLAKIIAEKLDDLHSEREKPVIGQRDRWGWTRKLIVSLQEASLTADLQARTSFPKAYFLFSHKVLRALISARLLKEPQAVV
jgi:hypothetical protein